VLDEQSTEVNHILHAWVESHVKHNDVRACHCPIVSSPKQGVCQERGKVTDGGVLDRGGLAPQIVIVPVNRNFLSRNHCLSEDFISHIEFSIIGKPKTIIEFLKREVTRGAIECKAHSAMLLVRDEVVGEGREELSGGVLVGVDVEGIEDLHARVLDHGDEVLFQPIVREEFFTYPLCRQHVARADPLVVLVEG
jgi:hypothetical protein